MSTWTWFVGVLIGTMAIAPAAGWAAEHGGQEHAGQEHGGATTAAPAATTQEHGGKEHGGQAAMQMEPSAEQIRQAIREYIAQVEQEEGAFTIEDEVTEKIRSLSLVRVHERVGKTGDYYYSCTDMTDAETGETLDLDFDVEAVDGGLEVADVRIHKVNDQARYTYDDQDHRVPVL
ncbi:MAG: hypothetical protein HYY91_03330 [Candidatus Omnitrophica bacterium]|nr:hypothetical protein [Candidatus Omnitrophota bacterium]